MYSEAELKHNLPIIRELLNRLQKIRESIEPFFNKLFSPLGESFRKKKGIVNCDNENNDGNKAEECSDTDNGEGEVKTEASSSGINASEANDSSKQEKEIKGKGKNKPKKKPKKKKNQKR